jgi:Ca-activated chloride channel family protein
MRALDIVPGDRLDAARSFIRRLVQPRPKASVGLVGFAGEAQGLSPLSPDRGAFDSARPGQLPDGTAIGNALASALDRLCPSGLAACRSNRRNKAIVLITDGGNNAGQISPLDAAELARLGGARVVAVLVGKGGKVDYPVVDDSGASTVRQVDFPVDPELVRAIASATGGSAFEVRERSDFEAVLPKVARHLDHAGSTPASSQKTFSDAEAARILGAVRRVEAATRGQR